MCHLDSINGENVIFETTGYLNAECLMILSNYYQFLFRCDNFIILKLTNSSLLFKTQTETFMDEISMMPWICFKITQEEREKWRTQRWQNTVPCWSQLKLSDRYTRHSHIGSFIFPYTYLKFYTIKSAFKGKDNKGGKSELVLQGSSILPKDGTPFKGQIAWFPPLVLYYL